MRPVTSVIGLHGLTVISSHLPVIFNLNEHNTVVWTKTETHDTF
jgi:hypothetical protein